jgi:hypothetical protein
MRIEGGMATERSILVFAYAETVRLVEKGEESSEKGAAWPAGIPSKSQFG